MGLIVYTLTTFTHYVMFCFLTTAFSVAAPLACSTISFRIVVKVGCYIADKNCPIRGAMAKWLKIWLSNPNASSSNLSDRGHPVTRILARLPRCMGMLAKILARSCQDLTKATMIMQDHGKADHASYQAYQDFPCILPCFSMCLAKHTKIFPTILSFYCIHELQ